MGQHTLFCGTHVPLTSPRSILQQRRIYRSRSEMDISNHAPSDEDVLDRAEMRVLEFIHHRDIVELDVEVLIHALEGASDRYVVL